ncbi:UPF0175 family protein [Leptolyngbya sp. AN02str]|uniref:UPF0175 family protein n=1 Tax=Leptolyngbya sp. AN02str TaxID=3423363 RepID=UPI003D310189
MQLTIPDSVTQSIRLPESRVQPELLKELAIALYSQELLSFTKAVELANIHEDEFSQLVGSRGVSRRCGRVEMNGESVYVCSE